ncbi:MAG: AAA family ATPase, partial [Sciscionella sp.]
MAEQAVRAALLLRTCMEILREATEPMAAAQVYAEVAKRVSLTAYEAELDRSGYPRWHTSARYQTGDAATVGWLTKVGGWSLTEAGEAALDTFPGDALHAEVRRRLTETLQQRRQALKQLSGEEQTIARALALVVPGFWTALDDLAELIGTDPDTIGHFLAKVGLTGAYRVLNSDGSALSQGMLNVNFRGVDIPGKLAYDGVELDESRRASQAQRITAADLRERLAEVKSEVDQSSTIRAWLVRGSSVEGRDLVPVWLHKQSVSLAAAELRPLTPPVERAELKTFVDSDYQHKSYAVREAKLAEFDAFCNRMRPDDLVLTTTQGKAYLGRITGDAEYVRSSDQRSNLRRTVEWLNETRPVAFAKLPDPLPAKLHSQSDVVELTEDIATIETLLGELGVEVDAPAPTPQRALVFPEITQELADELLIDRAWLQRQANLLWRRRQLIFYGPPGTGKTFLARKIAQHLAEPSAVKLVQFHPSYTYEDFFEGFRPVQGNDGQL